jgi:hypothetical protein
VQREADLVNHRFQTDLSGTSSHAKRADRSQAADGKGAEAHQKRDSAPQSTASKGRDKNVKESKVEASSKGGLVPRTKLASSSESIAHEASEGREHAANRGVEHGKAEDHLSKSTHQPSG